MQDKTRAADAVVSALESQIVSGALEGNTPLPPERVLMDQFGASRTVIREAISLLASRGMVESRPRFRPIVRKPDYGTVLDATGTIIPHLLNQAGGVKNMYMSRVFVERGLVRQAAGSATKDDIAALRSALSDNGDVIDDSSRFYATDVVFHGVLYDVPKNPVFPALHRGYSAWLAPQWGQMKHSIRRNTENHQAHCAIFDAILSRDPDLAERALDDHLGIAWKDVRDTFT